MQSEDINHAAPWMELLQVSNNKSADILYHSRCAYMEWYERKAAFYDKNVGGRGFPAMKMYVEQDTPGKCYLRWSFKAIFKPTLIYSGKLCIFNL